MGEFGSGSAVDGPTPAELFEVGFGFTRAKTLLAAVELDVFERLAEQPADGESLARRTGVHERCGADFFDALVALDVLHRENGVYRNTESARRYLVSDSPTDVSRFFAFASKRPYRAWTGLVETLQSGEPQAPGSEQVREGAFANLYEDERRLGAFLSAMSGLSAVTADALADRFPWERYDSLCDLGTAAGKVPIEVAARNDHLSAVGVDLPAVEPFFEEAVAARGLEDRVRFRACDFFADPLPDADVAVLGHVLQNWGTEKKRALLGRVRDALPDDGAAVVYGFMIDDDRRENALALQMSLNMAVTTEEGQGYTVAECERLLDEAGFAETRRGDLPGPDAMVLAEA